MEHKSVHVDVKDADEGHVVATFSRFDVIDSDRDVTLPNAFEEGAELVVSAYGHRSWQGDLPVGRGVIKVTPTEAQLHAQFFMNVPEARSTFEVIKQLGSLGQWSYGFDVLDSDFGEKDGQRVRYLKRLKVWEASPVLVGAGVDVRTVETRSREDTVARPSKAAIRTHSTGIDAGSWDAASVVSGLPEDASAADLKSVFAWVDPDGDATSKSSYKFPHHQGVGGKANMRACLAGIAALNGGRGGSDLSDADRKGVYNHLAAHLRDGDREPPELSSGPDGALKFSDEGAAVLASVSSYITRATEVLALRAEKGKSLSPGSLELIGWLDDDLKRLRVLFEPPAEQVTEPPPVEIEPIGLGEDDMRTLLAAVARVHGI